MRCNKKAHHQVGEDLFIATHNEKIDEIIRAQLSFLGLIKIASAHLRLH